MSGTTKATSFVLDASAVLAWLQAEPGARAVKELLRQARAGEVTLHLGLFTLGEVLCRVRSLQGARAEEALLPALSALPIQFVAAPLELVLRVPRYRVDAGLPYADAFVAATAESVRGTIVTADAHFRRVERLLSVRWIR